ncbi:MAG: hypothetical protein PVH40_09350, partial [Gemmatimonadales bacterium]
MRRVVLSVTSVLMLVAPAAGLAQIAKEEVDLAVVQQIREEGFERSQLVETIRYLTEVIGPRLTGSPGMREANEWTASKMREWGFENVVIEPWGEFGRGWESVSYSGRIVTPFTQPLHAHPVAWTGSTNGTVTGQAVIIQADSVADLERYRGRLRNAVVLSADPPNVEPEWEWQERRTPADELLAPPQVVDPEERRRRAEERAAQREQMMER